MVKIAPSILSADFSRLGEEVHAAQAAGADYIHIDVMDGHFVPNISVGPMVVEAVRRVTSLPLDVHLMVEEAGRHIPRFAEAGANILTVHYEANTHLHRVLEQIAGLGVRVGVSLNPATPLVCLEEVLDYVDLVLLMTVNPGFGGQTFIESSLGRIARLAGLMRERGAKAELEVDGGINEETAPRVVAAGANVLVAGVAIFDAEDGVAGAIERLRRSVEAIKIGHR
ncbi:MAG: ribulose-phosphate 3-epimerase [Anaerolineae bacterium]